ncbi:hypothetical protein I4U23_013113 [Adineta vaga]|nr:hypothetical protein I4U23_013113 [Adineta vaga]
MKTSIEQLPIELWIEILSYLEAHVIFHAFTNLNHHFDYILTSDHLLFNVELGKTDRNPLEYTVQPYWSKTILNRIIHLQPLISQQLSHIPEFLRWHCSELHQLKSLTMKLRGRQISAISNVLPHLLSLHYLSIKCVPNQILLDAILVTPNLNVAQFEFSRPITSINIRSDKISPLKVLDIQLEDDSYSSIMILLLSHMPKLQWLQMRNYDIYIDKNSESNLTTITYLVGRITKSVSHSPNCRRLKTVEDFIIIWLDSNIDESHEDSQTVINQLRQLINAVQTFNEIEQCITYFDEIKDERIFVIVSDTLGPRFVPRIYKKKQLASIYVLCDNKEEQKQWVLKFPMIKGIFTEIEDLCIYLKLDLRQNENNFTSFIAVIFRIQIDPTISTTPFADVKNVSCAGSGEQEILFSMHTIFRIGETTQLANGLYQVDLALTKDNDKQLVQLTEYMRKVTQGPTGLHRLGQLMCHMGEFDKAKEIYTTLVDTTSTDDRQQLALFHHQLGYISKKKNDLSSALSHYQESLDIKLTYLPSDDPQLSSTYCNIGSVLQDQGDLDGALEHLKFALKSDLRASKPDRLSIAIRHNNIGSVLEDLGNYHEALMSYRKALELQLSQVSKRHPSIATSYNNIGLVHRKMGDNLNALTYYRDALDIFERSLPSLHSSLATSHHNIAMVLDDLRRTKEAIKHAERALEITLHSNDIEHPDVLRRQAYLDDIRRKL